MVAYIKIKSIVLNKHLLYVPKQGILAILKLH